MSICPVSPGTDDDLVVAIRTESEDADGDESGYGHNGTVSGAALVSDRNGDAASEYDFDGVNDFVGAGTVTFSTPASLVLWFRSTAPNDI